jgi:hypothetical protein
MPAGKVDTCRGRKLSRRRTANHCRQARFWCRSHGTLEVRHSRCTSPQTRAFPMATEIGTGMSFLPRPADGTETYTYSQWIYLKADTDHTAGGPKSGSGKATSSNTFRPPCVTPFVSCPDNLGLTAATPAKRSGRTCQSTRACCVRVREMDHRSDFHPSSSRQASRRCRSEPISLYRDDRTESAATQPSLTWAEFR